MSGLENNVAIVTGGSRGIGKAIVLKLAELGCDVAFNYVHHADSAHEVEALVKGFGRACFHRQVDIKDYQAVKKWVDDVRNEAGRLDILVNNAGIIIDKALMMMTPDDWQSVIDTNLTGMFNASRACIVPFMKQKCGSIINISSVSGLIGLPRQTNYSASKGGMNAFTKSLAKEVGAYGIRVNAVAPGFIETDIIKHFSEEQRAEVNRHIPLGIIGSVADVAHCVSFLLSPAAEYITGEILTVDGGLTLMS